MQKRASRGDYLVILVLVALIIIVFSILYRQQFNSLLRGLEPSCIIGVSTSTITVQGWSANSDCQAMLSGPNNFTYQDWGRLGGSQVSEASGSIMCELDAQDRHIIVRDSLPQSNNGNIDCGILQGTIPNGVLPQQ